MTEEKDRERGGGQSVAVLQTSPCPQLPKSDHDRIGNTGYSTIIVHKSNSNANYNYNIRMLMMMERERECDE